MKNLLGGLAGAVALNILHETYKRMDAKAPRVDLVGEEVLTRVTTQAGATPLTDDILYTATLSVDIISNGLYYSLIGLGRKKNILLRGAVLGTAAGVGALTLTKPLGLSDAPVTRSLRTKVLTITWYLAGAMVTAFAIRSMKK